MFGLTLYVPSSNRVTTPPPLVISRSYTPSSTVIAAVSVADMVNRRRNGPAVLFDEIVDYPKGYRILVSSVASSKRLSLTLGLSTKLSGIVSN